MNIQNYFLTIIFTLTSMNALADTVDSQMTSQGFLLSIHAPALNVRYNVSSDDSGFRSVQDTETKSPLGLGAGYAFIREKALGVMGNIIFHNWSTDTKSLRAALSLTFGLNQYVYLFIGSNYHNFIQGADDLNPDVGGQFGIGVQVHKNFGAQFNYLAFRNYETFEGNRIEHFYSGLEISLHATF